jgi:LuxR family maltose regulon positive regulatory protein
MLRTKLALGRAITAAEAGDHETARGVLVELAGRPTYPDPSLQFLAALQLVELSVASGHLRDAVAQFTEAEVLFNQLVRHAAPDLRVTAAAALPSWLLTSLARAGVSVSLATDNLEAAAEWAERVSDPFWGPWWEARLHLAHGRRQEANDALVRGKPRCVRHQVLQLLACARAVPEGDRTSAVATVEPAVQLAAEHGLLQTVASNGTEVLELIELAAWRVPDAWLDRLRHLLIPTYTAHQSGPVEPLTEREREVLRLLPSRLTLREVASQLYVSQNTLKFHLRAIYRKLGVDSRATAVQAAREMRLLPTTGG